MQSFCPDIIFTTCRKKRPRSGRTINESSGIIRSVVNLEKEYTELEKEHQEYVKIHEPNNFEPEIEAHEIDATYIIPRRIESPEDNTIEQRHYLEIEDENVRIAIGRWSEEFVFRNLPLWGNYSDIVWENEINESGKPYDFKLIEDGKTKLVEVKGTTSSEKDLIYLSSNEWNNMFEQKDNYILIRVYNAGKTNVFPEIIENPSLKIEQGSIQVILRV